MIGKIEGSSMDSWTMIRDESEDNSEGGKPYLCGLAMSHYNINCLNVFAKIDIPPPLDFVYQHLSDSRLIALTPLNPIQPLFLGGIIQTRDVNIMVRSWAILLNSCKNFKNRDRMMVSKKRVEFVKDDVINHIVTRTSSDWQKIENAWPSTNIARKADPRMVLNCQLFCCGFLLFCILFWGHILSLNKTCLSFVFLLFWNQEMLLSKGILTKYFDQTPTWKIKASQS